jgi:hypothetical protein
MKVLALAAGLAAGYVLGTKAGRERYNQIVQGARKLADNARGTTDTTGTNAAPVSAPLRPAPPVV